MSRLNTRRTRSHPRSSRSSLLGERPAAETIAPTAAAGMYRKHHRSSLDYCRYRSGRSTLADESTSRRNNARRSSVRQNT
jgi:hypothetical protein